LVSRHGVHPLADSLDHAGPIARCVADAAVLLESIAGFDVRDLTTQRGLAPNYLETLTDGLKGFRLGIDEGFCTDGVDAEVGQAVLAASRVFGRLGATIRPVKISLVEEAIGAWAVIFTAECVSAHEKMFAAHADDYTPAFRQFQKDGARVRGVDYARAYATRQSVHRMLEDLFQDIDLFLCPTMGLLPPSLDVFPPNGLIPMELTGALLKFTAPFSLTGNPALSVPCGLSRNGLPIALEIVGRPRDEQTVLRAGYAYEQATEWHRRRPSV
jgi:amidase